MCKGLSYKELKPCLIRLSGESRSADTMVLRPGTGSGSKARKQPIKNDRHTIRNDSPQNSYLRDDKKRIIENTCSMKLTKILATIPNGSDESFIRTLYESGMNAVRLNTAHQNPEEALGVIRAVRSVSDKIAILVDTKGPEVRTRDIEVPISVSKGDELRIVRQGSAADRGKSFSVSYSRFIEEMAEGNSILIDDGLVELKVKKKEEEYLLCEARNNGEIKKNKNVNTPGIHLNLPTLQDKDKDFIHFAIEQDLDFIAHSFVRNKEDVMAIQDILDAAGSQIKIIAKIENTEGVKHLDEILEHAAGIMVARGDLGVELPFEKLPSIQKHIIGTCIRKAKIVITATQMLHTMIENPRPTRAEVSDVANAVFDGTDVLMLSGETAYGKYPAEAVRTMARIAEEAEAHRIETPFVSEATSNRIRSYLAATAAHAARELPVKAIIADTESGRIARIISSYRCSVPIYAKSSNARTVRELALTYGVYSDLLEAQPSTDHLVRNSITSLLMEGLLEPEDLVVTIGGTPGYSGATNFIQINTAAMGIKEL